jgi:hypothetical protein
MSAYQKQIEVVKCVSVGRACIRLPSVQQTQRTIGNAMTYVFANLTVESLLLERKGNCLRGNAAEFELAFLGSPLTFKSPLFHVRELIGTLRQRWPRLLPLYLARSLRLLGRMLW